MENSKHPRKYPLFIGPILLHYDSTEETFRKFLSIIKTELQKKVPGIEVSIDPTFSLGQTRIKY